MSYPEKYDIKYKRWSLNTLPFLPSEFKYEIIPDVKKQFEIVSGLLERKDVERIYVCTDSGREGEYIYRLVEMMSDQAVAKKDRRRVWIDSQTEEEIQRGVREAKDLSAYDHLSDAAYLRAKEDYLMGINFSRLLTLKYGSGITNYLGTKWSSVSVGRVMLTRNRVSRIYYRKHFFDYPVKMNANTIKNMGFGTTMEAGFSYLGATVHKLPETSLENFYINRFGKKLYSMFFEGYTEKLWGRHPRDISADWGSQRVKGLSVSAIMGRMHSDAQFAGSSSVPAHVEMMGLIGMGNNPMVGATVAVAVAIEEAAKANKF